MPLAFKRRNYALGLMKVTETVGVKDIESFPGHDMPRHVFELAEVLNDAAVEKVFDLLVARRRFVGKAVINRHVHALQESHGLF